MYELKKSEYFSTARNEVLDLVPLFSERVLEIGCGTGETLAMLKSENRCGTTTGVELYPDAAKQASCKVDNVLNIDVQNNTIDGKFDLILFLDVLEHLIDPWIVLKKIIEKNLNEGGVVILSIPNFRHYSVLAKLLAGNFDYQLSGILDKTHLRFFTKKTMVSLCKEANLEVIDCIVTNFHKASRSGFLNKITLGLFSDFLAVQYVLKSVKSN